MLIRSARPNPGVGPGMGRARKPASVPNTTTIAMVANEYRRNRIPCAKAPNAITATMKIDITNVAAMCRASRCEPTVPRTSIGKKKSPAVLTMPYPTSAVAVRRTERLPCADAQTPAAKAKTRRLYGVNSQMRRCLVGAPTAINSLTICEVKLW